MPVGEWPIWYGALKPRVKGREDLALEVALRTRTGREIRSVPGCLLSFPRWTGGAFTDDLGKKSAAWVELHGEHLFAELGILRLLEGDGWSGRWINSYRSGAHGPKSPRLQTAWEPGWRRDRQRHVPIEDPDARELLGRLARTNAEMVGEKGEWYGGCWDVFAWKGGRYLFVESKYKDRVKPGQLQWLEVAARLDDERLKLPDSFAIVRWKYE